MGEAGGCRVCREACWRSRGHCCLSLGKRVVTAKLGIATTTAGSSHERRPEPVLPGTVVAVARVCVSELTGGVLGVVG